MIIRSTLPSSYMKYWISLVLALLQASSADAFLTSPRLSSLGRSQTKSNILRKRDDIPAIGFFDPNAQDGGHFLTVSLFCVARVNLIYGKMAPYSGNPGNISYGLRRTTQYRDIRKFRL